MPEPRNGGKWAEWALLALALVLAVFVLDGVRAQDAPTEQIRCSNGWCLVPEQTLIDIARTLGAMREQLEEYAKLCRWGTR